MANTFLSQRKTRHSNLSYKNWIQFLNSFLLNKQRAATNTWHMQQGPYGSPFNRRMHKIHTFCSCKLISFVSPCPKIIPREMCDSNKIHLLGLPCVHPFCTLSPRRDRKGYLRLR